MGNIHGNCINVDRLERNGLDLCRASAGPDFLTANDAWFMPVVQKTGPDGSLYILDWYDRYHCYQDANRDPAGIDRLKGRLYRVRYKDTPRRPASTSSRDRRRADRAARQPERLLPRHRPAPPDASGKAPRHRQSWKPLVLNESSPRKARLHALWALVGSGADLVGFPR